MNLEHAFGDVLNSILKDEDGRAMYEIRTSVITLRSGTTTVLRISGYGAEEIAQIEWHYFSSTLFHFKDYTVKLSSYMPPRGFGRSKRVFVASDGQSYLWIMDSRGGLKLQRDDGSKALVAQYYPRTNIFTRPTSIIEITPLGLGIVDEIVVTFLYMERKRQEAHLTAN